MIRQTWVSGNPAAQPARISSYVRDRGLTKIGQSPNMALHPFSENAMVRSSILCLGLSLLFVACKPALRPDGGGGLLPVGAVSPDVSGTTSDGRSTTRSAARGQAAVVYFYPKDETPGCTKEACAFRDVFARYEARHVAIFGVSRDSEESHTKFRTNHALPFPLVSDEDGTIANACGVSSTLGMTSRCMATGLTPGSGLRSLPRTSAASPMTKGRGCRERSGLRSRAHDRRDRGARRASS
jgi:peroxiredoxin